MKVFLLLAAVMPMVMGIENFEGCANGAVKPHKLSIAGCDSAPCHFQSGQVVEVEAEFKAGKYQVQYLPQ